jgi:hypothetical protein
MSEKFQLVKSYVLDMDLKIIHEDEPEELVIVEDEENGIKNLVIDCEDPILILEQVIMPVPADTKTLYTSLLKMNRSLVHGAFAIDEEEKLVLFRDTLQLENLDFNELEASIEALSLAMAEHSAELLKYV